jgi:hypothetical protein
LKAGPARRAGKIAVLVFIIVFIQKRPQGIFAMKGREAMSTQATFAPDRCIRSD